MEIPLPEGHLEVIRGFRQFSGKMSSEEKVNWTFLFHIWVSWTGVENRSDGLVGTLVKRVLECTGDTSVTSSLGSLGQDDPLGLSLILWNMRKLEMMPSNLLSNSAGKWCHLRVGSFSGNHGSPSSWRKIFNNLLVASLAFDSKTQSWSLSLIIRWTERMRKRKISQSPFPLFWWGFFSLTFPSGSQITHLVSESLSWCII